LIKEKILENKKPNELNRIDIRTYNSQI